MGFAPEQTGAMSLWELLACWDGYAKANGIKTNKGTGAEISEDRLRKMGIEGF